MTPGRVRRIGRGGFDRKQESYQVKLIRKDLVNALRTEHGLSKRKADKTVRAIFDAIAAGLRRGEQIHTPIGSFKQCRKPVGFVNKVLDGRSGARRSRLIRPRRSIRFIPGGSLADCEPHL
jgi:nucleoid DNA-binding protein